LISTGEYSIDPERITLYRQASLGPGYTLQQKRDADTLIQRYQDLQKVIARGGPTRPPQMQQAEDVLEYQQTREAEEKAFVDKYNEQLARRWKRTKKDPEDVSPPQAQGLGQLPTEVQEKFEKSFERTKKRLLSKANAEGKRLASVGYSREQLRQTRRELNALIPGKAALREQAQGALKFAAGGARGAGGRAPAPGAFFTHFREVLKNMPEKIGGKPINPELMPRYSNLGTYILSNFYNEEDPQWFNKTLRIVTGANSLINSKQETIQSRGYQSLERDLTADLERAKSQALDIKVQDVAPNFEQLDAKGKEQVKAKVAAIQQMRSLMLLYPYWGLVDKDTADPEISRRIATGMLARDMDKTALALMYNPHTKNIDDEFVNKVGDLVETSLVFDKASQERREKFIKKATNKIKAKYNELEKAVPGGFIIFEAGAPDELDEATATIRRYLANNASLGPLNPNDYRKAKAAAISGNYNNEMGMEAAYVKLHSILYGYDLEDSTYDFLKMSADTAPKAPGLEPTTKAGFFERVKKKTQGASSAGGAWLDALGNEIKGKAKGIVGEF